MATTAPTNDTAATGSNASTGATGATGSLQQTAQPYLDKAKAFAKQRPFASAALAGVVGLAFLNTLRGK